ncbi:unnamed protein product [Trifolium pratense]|uniref:Uncharacterized protein n=1 Tax=Trifolium pratense TaxID=57577 RepID=A0ACB0JAS0_TRIPR|nr:unnamed protein product [Trifolium pratense]
MDRSWMKASRLSAEFERGVIEFIRFAEINLPSPENNDEKNLPPKGKEHFRCPCVLCGNKKLEIHKDKIISHLICNGICQNYTKWIWHGEVVTNRSVSQSENISVDMDDRLEDMMRDIGEDSFKTAHVHDTLCSDKDTPLYPGCTNFTRLSAVLKLFNLKAKNGWTDKSFSELLELLTQMLPEGNIIPNRCYEAKKVLCPMGLEYERIHACPNDCILYRKEFANSDHCPKCMASRYKKKDGDSSDDVVTKKGSPVKVVWYLPIIPRFKRLFANANDAKNLRWHVEERKCDGQIRHVADSLQWKKIDSLFPNFGKESRNLRLGLATDGMNPFGNQSTNHSSWPVLLMIYNLSPWLCMKRKYIMLSMMISGPRQPGNDIDVYLSPLIDDLRVLWEQGVDVFDAYSGEQFNMRAMLFCTINDFPAYGNLSGYSVKGHLACPICAKDTNFKQLKKGKKTVYLGHRRFLNRYHPYRRLRKAFNDHPEDGVAPEPLTGEQVYELQRDINVVFGKDVGKGKKKGKKKSDVEEKKSDVKISWNKRSVFFDLPYWSSLDVRHCIDVMHVEKNVCDSVIGTLLNIAGKTKDGINARLDMDLMGIRKELLPQQINNRTYLPPACYTLSKKEKTSFCECLKSIKVPHGYSSNVNKLVSMNDLKLIGLKSHDCHVLMQQLLPVAIRGILPDNVRKTISRLCLFFNAICCKAIDPLKLDELENEAAVILCQLEMYFPPSFFDIMVHLIVHLGFPSLVTMEDVKSYFDIPVINKDRDKDPLRNAWLSYAGDRWRGFKTQLTREYVSRPKEDHKPPYVRYTFIKPDVWKQFLASRDTPEFKLSQLEEKLRAEFEEKMAEERQLMQKTMMETLKSVGFSQNASPTKQVVDDSSPKHVAGNYDSMKASCFAAPTNIKEDLDNGVDSVQKLLCMIVKRKTYLPIQLEHDKIVKNFKMSPKYMKDLLVGDNWLDLSILQLWCTYMQRVSIDTKKSDLFAFLDPVQLSFASKPVSLQKAGKQYIQNNLRDLNKVCYLAPHLFDGHWQLIIMCPKDNVIVCLCSLHRKIPEAARNFFNPLVCLCAFKVHQLATFGNRKKATWIFPKTRRKPNGNDCGYYVMKNMLDIVTASITKNWMEVFDDPTSLTEEEMYELRNNWATCFLDLYNPEVDYVVSDDEV